MKKFILNGRFMAQPLTGVQRFALEILKRFANMKDVKVLVALPPDAAAPTVISENIEYVTVGKHTGTRWEQFDLPRFCKQKKLPLLCTGNSAPIRYRSYVVLHDILWIDMKKYVPKRSWSIKSKLMVRSFVYKNKGLFTVSEFSAHRIKARFPRANPVVLYSGWEHVKDWEETPVEGVPTSFYLSVGAVYPHKNFDYVLRLALAHPEEEFVVVGIKHVDREEYLRQHGIKNCHFTGYLSDGQIKWLYAHCEGFILPSLYEGFGLPPLEAVACGCRRIFLSDIPVFHEIYGDAANFFDPLDFVHTADLKQGKEISCGERDKLLKKYTWEECARGLAEHI